MADKTIKGAASIDALGNVSIPEDDATPSGVRYLTIDVPDPITERFAQWLRVMHAKVTIGKPFGCTLAPTKDTASGYYKDATYHTQLNAVLHKGSEYLTKYPELRDFKYGKSRGVTYCKRIK